MSSSNEQNVASVLRSDTGVKQKIENRTTINNTTDLYARVQ